MMAGPLTEQMLSEMLHRVLSRCGGGQLFLFGPEGEPFWAARIPVARPELQVLRSALDLLEAV